MRMIIFALLLAISYAQTDSDIAQLAMERKDSGLINEAEVAVAGSDGNVCCQCFDGTYGMSGTGKCSICKGQTDVMFQHPDKDNCKFVDPKDKKAIKACADKCVYDPERDGMTIPDSGVLDTFENVCCKCCDGRFAFSKSGRCSPCGGKIDHVFVHSDTSCRNPAGKGKVKACAGTCKDVQNPYLISRVITACPRFESKVGSAVDSIDAHVVTAEVAVGEGHICCRCCDGTYTHSVSGSCSICEGKGGIGEMFRHSDQNSAIGNCRNPAPEDINACAKKCGSYEMPTLLPPKKDQKACPRVLPSDPPNICCKCCDGTYTHSVSGTCSMCKGKRGIAEMFRHSKGSSCKNPSPGEMNACLKKCETYEMPTLLPPKKDQKACPSFESKVGSAVDSIGAHVDTNTTIWIGCILLFIIILFTLKRHRKSGSDLSISFLPANELADLTTTL